MSKQLEESNMSYDGNISYNQLMWMYKNIKPYKNTNEYPYSDRNHRYKYFIPVEVNGKIEFNVHYYWGSVEDNVSMEEYERLKPMLTQRELGRYWMREGDHGIPYMTKWRHIHNPFGIVRDDNTIEILYDRMGQGERMIISEQLGVKAYFMQESISGGVIFTDRYSQANRTLKRPAFKGMRFNITTGELHESSRYKINVKVVDRKKSNELLKEHKDKLAMLKMFYNTTDVATMSADMKGVITQEEMDKNIDYLKRARELWESDPVASSYYYMLGYYVGNAYWALRYDNQLNPPSLIYRALITKIKKDLQGNSDIFTKHSYWDFDNMYPTARWGLEITDMQGNKLKQIRG